MGRCIIFSNFGNNRFQGVTMTFANRFHHSAQPLIDAILQHPFNLELASGKLARDRFAYYLQQDELYLHDYARALALAAAKAPNGHDAAELLSYAHEGVLTEQQLHDHYFKKFTIAPAQEQQPACFTYCCFLLSVCALDPYEMCLAALLPCFWIYQDVAMLVSQAASEGNPYQEWIDVYTDPSYQQQDERIIAMTETAAASASASSRVKMGNLFLQSTRLELHFYDAAYRLEKWPLS
jgi:thiaminase (transcriptional activator TenA)